MTPITPITETFRLRFEIGVPLLEDETLDGIPVFSGDRAECSGLELVRHIRDVPGGFAVSLRIRNLRSESVRLRRLSLLHCDMDGFHGTGPFSEWKIFRMARQKNDIPGFFRPSKVDEDMEDALFDSSEATAGAGISWEDFSKGLKNLPCRFTSDPGIILFPGKGVDPVFIGFVGQDLHLNEVNLETVPDRQSLKTLTALAAFDGARLQPGAEFSTHELVVRTGKSLRELLEWHAESVASLYQVPPPPVRKPVVFCSWYFYGKDIREEDVEENLKSLREKPVPFDVFQIDHGWLDKFGDWKANEKFPSGLDHLAEMIRNAGYTPGIWTAPFVLQPDSEILKKYPDLVLKSGTGSPCIFKCEAGDCYVVDPYSPNAERYLQELFQRLKRHGFLYHKLDFVRAIILNEDVRYADPTKNRAQAYRHGIRMIRDAVGADGYFEVCGGLYEGTAGLANAVRSGCDVRGHWEGTPTRINAYLIRIKQNVFRNHYNRFWHTDPDALQLRRRTEPFRGYEKGRHLAMGTFSDEEAFSTVVNQFLGGGLVCMAERLADFDEDRRLLYRHVVPQFAIPATPLDAEDCTSCPDRFLTRFDHPENGLVPWRILTLANWDNEEKIHEIRLGTAFLPGSDPGAVALFEFREQRFLGVFDTSSAVRITVPAHGCRVLRLTTVPEDRQPLLVGTDLNLSQGMELELWEVKGASVRARVNTPWNCPVTLTVLKSDRKTIRKIRISPDPSDKSDKSDKSDS